MKRLFSILFILIFLNFNLLAADEDNKPNIVFILADDLGWSDLSCMGSTLYETPNIDRIAENGILFKNAYAASPFCSPTRASILTGFWPSRIGMTRPAGHHKNVVLEPALEDSASPDRRSLVAIPVTRLNTEYETIAESFKKAGYVTAHIGKWHLGHEPYDPLHHGFDIDIPHTPFAAPMLYGYLAPWPAYPGEGKKGEHLEDRMAEEAVKFIKDHADKPFFLNYWAFSVHNPWNTKQELIEKYEKKIDLENPQHNPVYAGMIEVLDDAVGKLLKTLEDEQLIKNTIIIFYSDNGGYCWEGRSYPGLTNEEYIGVPITSNTPLRSGKGTLYEGGVRVPLMVWWPGTVEPGSVNQNDIVSSVDIFPTLLDMCNIDASPKPEFDGLSIVDILKGGSLSRNEFFCHFPHETGHGPGAGSLIRKGDWKLIRYYHDNFDQSDSYELYNLKWDIGETSNLSELHKDKVKELSILMDTYLENTQSIIPVPNPKYLKFTQKIK